MTLELTFIGLAITLEPIPFTAFILVVASKGGVKKGAAFIFGWLLSLTIVIAVTLLATGNKPPKPSTVPSLTALALKIAIGVALLVIAIHQGRRMGRPKKAKKTPKWQSGIDSMSPWTAIGLAPLTQPWGLVAVGVADISEAKLSSAGSYLVLLLFCVAATSTFLALEIYTGFWPARAQVFISRLRAWVDTHTDQVIIIVSLLLGAWLIGKSIYLIITQ